jgi:hypothetical protein
MHLELFRTMNSQTLFADIDLRFNRSMQSIRAESYYQSCVFIM